MDLSSGLPADVPTLQALLEKSAIFGKELLEANAKLSEELQAAKSVQAKCEEYEQETHALRSQLKTKQMMESAYEEETESLRAQLERANKEYEERLEERLHRNLHTHQQQLSDLEESLERCKLSERQAKDKNQQLQEDLDDVRCQLEERLLTLNQTSSEEMAALQTDNTALRADNASIRSELQETTAQLESLHLQLTTHTKNDAQKEQMIEELQCQNNSYFNALEKSRTQVQDLNVQLNVLNMENQRHQKKGNSLFSEVEDRRVAVEKQLVVVKGRLAEAEEQLQASKKHNHKLKFQIAGLLQWSAGKVDEEHIVWLQRQLNHTQAELQKATQKLADLPQQESASSSELVKQAFRELGSENDEHKFVQLLLKKKDDEIARVEKELSTTKLYLTEETMRVHDANMSLHRVEKQLTASQAQCRKHKLTIEELRLKYEPDKVEVDKKNKPREFVEEVIPKLAKPAESLEPLKELQAKLDPTSNSTAHGVDWPDWVKAKMMKKDGGDATEAKENKPAKAENFRRSDVFDRLYKERRQTSALPTTTKLPALSEDSDQPSTTTATAAASKKHVQISDNVDVIHDSSSHDDDHSSNITDSLLSVTDSVSTTDSMQKPQHRNRSGRHVQMPTERVKTDTNLVKAECKQQ